MRAEPRHAAADEWPSIPTVVRVMTGWFVLGLGLLDLLCGWNDVPYVVFHAGLALGGVILLCLHRIAPGGPGWAATAVVALGGLAAGTALTTTRCCLTGYPQRRGYPLPFLGTGTGTTPHADLKYAGYDLAFWTCAGLIALTVVSLTGRLLPERRTPVDLSDYVGRHAEAQALATELPQERAPGDIHAARHRAGENVGGLT
ncbi:hypothetical protein [Actinoplanes sp. NPDC051851]|uniref:hypothetical protein n=1 Tax=Actinoplanes sp. NPDC051851 TaxID=3154753 RepID=UPI00341DA532